MLLDFIEVENFFDDPDEILKIAKQQTFVEKDAHYHSVNMKTYYNGVRSKGVSDIDPALHTKICEQLSKKVVETRFGNDVTKTKMNSSFNAQIYFHIMREQDIFQETWKHKDDESILAGVIYLNPQPKPESGTIVHRYGDDKEPVIVENKYNKMVLYNASFLHAPQCGFGTDINDCRLTLVFFINQIGFNVITEHFLASTQSGA